MQVESALELELGLAEAVEGWMSREELAELAHSAARVPSGQAVVEIGNYRGRSTVALALGARRAGAHVWSVDPHAEFVGPRGGRFGRADMAQLYANLARSGVGADVSLVCLPSLAAARAFEGSIGLLFIDGDHRYAAVRADFEAWSAHLAPGARVIFDDLDFADVARWTAELVAAGRLTSEGGTGKLGLFRA
jgi:predicted O-methyltransferase YrrM